MTLPIADLKLPETAGLAGASHQGNEQRERRGVRKFFSLNQIPSFICAAANGGKTSTRLTRFDDESNSLILCFESKQILNRMESKLFAYKYPDLKICKTNRMLKRILRSTEKEKETNSTHEKEKRTSAFMYEMKSK